MSKKKRATQIGWKGQSTRKEVKAVPQFEDVDNDVGLWAAPCDNNIDSAYFKIAFVSVCLNWD